MSPAKPRTAIVAAGIAAAACFLPSLARAADGHGDPVAVVALGLAAILLAAKIGGDIAVRLGQPAVLGELIAGVTLGNLPLVGVTAFAPIGADPSLEMLARLGAIILLFETGLESTIGQMMRVGVSSFLVAVIGVVTPFFLGWGVGAALLPGHSIYVHLFLGATLTATSVGITARVLKDLGKSRTDEARIILGAAVIDDVLGLVILSAVTGAIIAADRGGTASWGAVGLIVLKATIFLGGALALGAAVTPPALRWAARMRSPAVLLAAGLAFCFTLAWAADAIGLAPIVGAFAAGLILEEIHYKPFKDRGEHGLDELVRPISAFLVPVFFVLMGMKTDLRTFADPRVLLLAAVLTVAAIVGKQACGLGVVGRGVDRLIIGIGMTPRGEVGLIFANIGLGLAVGGERIVDQATYSAAVIMVILTTMATPPALTWAFRRR